MISDSPASLRQEKAAMSITIKLVGQAGDFLKLTVLVEFFRVSLNVETGNERAANSRHPAITYNSAGRQSVCHAKDACRHVVVRVRSSLTLQPADDDRLTDGDRPAPSRHSLIRDHAAAAAAAPCLFRSPSSPRRR